VAVEDVLPEFHHRERHAIHVDAEPERALAAALAVTPREAPLLRLLFQARGLAAEADLSVWEQMRRRGFGEVAPETLAANGRPWQLLGGMGASEGSFAKMALDFRAESGELSMETRVWLIDAAARRRFRLYWLVVQPFSRLVRRSWLRAARRRAEAVASRRRRPVAGGDESSLRRRIPVTHGREIER
jgi:hypothetical protein